MEESNSCDERVKRNGDADCGITLGMKDCRKDDEETLDEKRWLEYEMKYSKLEEDKLRSIFYFTLIWNIFEARCCGKFGKIDEHPKKITDACSNQLDDAMIQEVFLHFRGRYVRDGEVTEDFRTFSFGPTRRNRVSHKELVRQAMLSTSPSKQERVETLLKIAFRLRNNLFHGEKAANRLYEQNENFRQINRLLMEIIEKYKGQEK